MEFDRRTRFSSVGGAAAHDAPTPGKQTLTQGMVQMYPPAAPSSACVESARPPLPVPAGPRATLQMLFGRRDRAQDPDQVHAAAVRGTATTASQLPHLEQIQRSFGRHDVSDVQAHVGSDAAASAREMGAAAYATGNHVVLGAGTDLYTVAHEAAHVVQQRGGVHLADEVGKTGDVYEQHADQVADLVVQGKSAEALLDQHAGGASAPVQRSAVQRMIDTDAPVNGTGWDEIERYLERTLVNKRKQTFREAVEEYIATGVTGADVVQNRWQQVNNLRGQDGQENTVLRHLRTIRATINDHKRQVPDHPNKQGIGPERERYETIPQSARSKQVAQDMRTTLIDSMLNRYDSRTKRYRHWRTGLWAKVKGYWSEQFMLGVVVLPSAEVRVSHSGFMGPTQAQIFTELVENARYVSEHHVDYDDVIGHYVFDLQHTPLPTNHVIEPNNHGKDALKYQPPHGLEEVGNPIGVCAAPHGLDDLGSIDDEFPPELTGNTPMALTEVWVSTNDRSRVTVHDVNNQRQQYRGNQDVPSCLTCQHQLRVVMKKLTDLRRNVVNRENVQREETHRWELIAAVEQLKQVLKNQGLRDALVGHIVPGVKSIEGAHIEEDLRVLDQHLTAYQLGIDTQAKERTTHPEHVEHDDKTANHALDDLVDAEDGTRREHYESLWAKRNVVGKMFESVEAPLVKARNDESERQGVENRAMTSSTKRDEKRVVETFGETAALQSAELAIDRLLGYRARGFVTLEQAQHFAEKLRAQLAEHRQATTELESLSVGWSDSTSTPIERGSVHDNHVTPRAMTPESRKQSDLLNWRLAQAVKAIEKLLGELEEAVVHGSRDREDERDRLSEEAGRHAQQSTEDRDYMEQLRVADEVWKLQTSDLLARNQAGIDARASSARREQREEQEMRDHREQAQLDREVARVDALSSNQRRNEVEEDFSSRMWSQAMSLARIYETSIEHQLKYLLQQEQEVNIVSPGPTEPQKPLRDYSDEYID